VLPGDSSAPTSRPQRTDVVRLQVHGDLPHVTEEHRQIPESHVYADIMHLVDCIAENREPLVTGAHARHVVELIEKGYEASRTGRTQQLRTAF